jgi:hypothetical protein
MDFAFYDHDPDRRGLRSAVRPFRRLLRRLQRPYFHRLRDLLTFLYHTHLEHQKREDDLTAHVTAAHDLATQRADALQRQVAELEWKNAELRREWEAARQQLRAFGVDYLAMSRRLAQLEDLLLQVHASLPAVPANGESADGAIALFPTVPQAKAS